MISKIFRFYRLPLYIMVRPFDGFYDMKHRNEGRVWLAFLNLALVCASLAFSNQYASIFVNEQNPMTLNSFLDVIILCGALLLFCISNWSVSSLTDGEGKFKEIFMAVCYAMTPLILIIVPATIMSNALVAEETGFFMMIIGVAIVYFVFLAFAGLIVVHNYGASKALGTLFLTFVALVIIVFLITLLLTLWQQLISFVQSLYTEITFRR